MGLTSDAAPLDAALRPELVIDFGVPPPWADVARMVKELSDAGVRLADIALRLGCHRTWPAKALAYWYAGQESVAPDGRAARGRLTPTPEALAQRDRAKALWDGGLPVQEIAAELGCCRDTSPPGSGPEACRCPTAASGARVYPVSLLSPPHWTDATVGKLPRPRSRSSTLRHGICATIRIRATSTTGSPRVNHHGHGILAGHSTPRRDCRSVSSRIKIDAVKLLLHGSRCSRPIPKAIASPGDTRTARDRAGNGKLFFDPYRGRAAARFLQSGHDQSGGPVDDYSSDTTRGILGIGRASFGSLGEAIGDFTADFVEPIVLDLAEKVLPLNARSESEILDGLAAAAGCLSPGLSRPVRATLQGEGARAAQ